MSREQSNAEVAQTVSDRYRGTDDRDGICLLACVECDGTWPEGRFEDGKCPDCRGVGRL